MALIKKPEVADFRDSTTVRAVRGADSAVRESGWVAARAFSKLYLGILGYGLIASLVATLAQARSLIGVVIVLAMIVGAVLLLRRLLRGPSRPADAAIEDGSDNLFEGVSVPLPAHLRTAAQEEGFHIDYWGRALSEKAGWRIILGLIMVFLSAGFMMVVGILLLAQGLLLVSPLLGSRACVRADSRTLTVHSLLGAKTVAWEKIDNVTLQSFSRRNAWVILSSGSRHNLVVRGQHDFDIVELLIPYPLLGLDRPGAKRLATRIMDARGRAIGGATAEPRAPALRPAPAVATDRPPAMASSAEAPEAFDPDKIMARYLAEREATLRTAQMPPVHRTASFGRKRLG